MGGLVDMELGPRSQDSPTVPAVLQQLEPLASRQYFLTRLSGYLTEWSTMALGSHWP